MREGNTDVKYAFTSMLDSVLELFSGKITYQELMDMDMPMMRAMVKSRLENLNKRKSQGPDIEKLIKNM